MRARKGGREGGHIAMIWLHHLWSFEFLLLSVQPIIYLFISTNCKCQWSVKFSQKLEFFGFLTFFFLTTLFFQKIKKKDNQYTRMAEKSWSNMVISFWIFSPLGWDRDIRRDHDFEWKLHTWSCVSAILILDNQEKKQNIYKIVGIMYLYK